MNRRHLIAALLSAVVTSVTMAQSAQPLLVVANQQSNDLTSFSVSDGLLVATQTVSLDAISPSLVRLTADGAFLIATASNPADPGGGVVLGFGVDAAGTITPIPTLVATVPSAPIGMAIAVRSGRTFIYLFPILSEVYAFELVVGASGPVFQPVPGQPFASPGFMYFGDAAATADGTHVYAVKAFNAGIVGYNVATDGSLTLLDMPELAALEHFRAVAISPDGQNLYAATHGDVPSTQTPHVRAYAVAGDGFLSELPGSPFSASSVQVDRVGDMAISPDGAPLTTLNSLSKTISVMDRAPDGTLTVASQTPPQTHDLVAVAMDDATAFVLVDMYFDRDPILGSGVLPMHIARDESLAALIEEPVPAGAFPISLALWLPATGGGRTGDLNADGIVDGADLGILLGAWGSDDPIVDLNGDGVVNGADLGILLAAWTA